jgi:hypothetical protein
VRAGATDPSGVTWDVHVEWIGRRLDQGPLLRRWHERRRRRANRRLGREKEKGSWLDALDFPVDLPDSLAALAIAVAVVVAIVLIVLVGPWFLALLFGAIELTLILLACIAVIVWRTVLRRPWRVVAIAADGREHHWDVVGWRRSRERVRQVARGLEAGVPPAAIVSPIES